MDEHDDLIRRLQQVGRHPVAAATEARALARARGTAPPRRHTARLKIAAAALGGFMVGSMGLATAGALPDTAQDAAHTVLDKVGVNVPAGHERYNDPGVCPGGPYKNHGAYVRAHKDDPNAGTSPCGKPLNAVNHPSGANGNGPDTSSGGNGAPGNRSKGHGKGNSGKPDKADENATNGADDHDTGATTSTTASPAVVPAATTTTESPTTTTAPATTIAPAAASTTTP